MRKLINHLKDSILMRLRLVWVALTKKNFICFAYNRRATPTCLYLKGYCLFSHLPDKLNYAEQMGLDCLCLSIEEIKKSKSKPYEKDN